MSIETQPIAAQTIEYPESDGKPMADNTKQFPWIVTIEGGLDAQYRDDPNVFVAGDLLWYPVEGRPVIRAAPDVMVAFGRPKGDRGSYHNSGAKAMSRRRWYSRYCCRATHCPRCSKSCVFTSATVSRSFISMTLIVVRSAVGLVEMANLARSRRSMAGSARAWEYASPWPAASWCCIIRRVVYSPHMSNWSGCVRRRSKSPSRSASAPIG
jgi:hypothetical protein